MIGTNWLPSRWSAPREEATYCAPVLITGCPRTGSTALARCLSRHPHICITSEAALYDLKDDYLARRRPDPSFHLPADAAATCQQVWATLHARRMTNAEVRRQLFDAIAEVKPLHVYGDKVPDRYLKQMACLSQRFPEARFIITIRDGRDVIASQLRWHAYSVRHAQKPEWWMRPTVRAAQDVWLNAMHTWEQLRDCVAPERWREVMYSSATRHPSETMQHICSFLQVPFDSKAFRGDDDPYRAVHDGYWRLVMPDLEQHLSRPFLETLHRWGFQ